MNIKSTLAVGWIGHQSNSLQHRLTASSESPAKRVAISKSLARDNEISEGGENVRSLLGSRSATNSLGLDDISDSGRCFCLA
jgi:hypothetical protein